MSISHLNNCQQIQNDRKNNNFSLSSYIEAAIISTLQVDSDEIINNQFSHSNSSSNWNFKKSLLQSENQYLKGLFYEHDTKLSQVDELRLSFGIFSVKEIKIILKRLEIKEKDQKIIMTYQLRKCLWKAVMDWWEFIT